MIYIITGALAASLLLYEPVYAGSLSEPGEIYHESEDTSELTEAGDYTRELAKRSQTTDPEDAVISVSEGTMISEKKTHTVMVYMVGSNLESRRGKATQDIEEMLASGLEYDDVNVLLYTGGSRRWVGEVPCDRNCVLDLSKTTEEWVVASTSENANMGSAETLSNFVNFCSEYYPADHNTLIFWDHGGGPLWGYGSDELFSSDSLLLSELRAAMDATEYGEEKKLDTVGFDACLMASLENMALWQDYADYYIASEELEPGEGWDYSFLKVFEETDDPVEIGKAVVDSYAAYYEQARTETSDPDITLSFVDLSKIPDIAGSLNDLSASMTDDLSGGAYASIVQKRAEAKSFGLSENAKGYISYYYDLVDVGDLCEKLSEYYPKETSALIETLKNAVVWQTANIECAGGVSLYFPLRNKTQYTQMKVAYEGVASAPYYIKFLARSAVQWLKSRGRDWKLGSLTDAGSEYTLKLSEDQLNNITSADYSILAESSAGGYVPYLSSISIKPDENGVLHIPKSVPMVALQSDNGEYMVWPVSEVESDESRTVYRTNNTGLRSDITYSNHLSDSEREKVSVLMVRDKETGVISIQSFNSSEDSEVLGGKDSVDISQWEELYYYHYPAYTTKDINGNILPFSDWTATGVTSWSDMPIDEGFSFEMIYSDETGMELVCQLEITDINGEKYATTPAEMSKDEERREIGMNTTRGELTFALYSDHAAVVDYSGRDRILTIPSEVEGLPVTEIGDGTFGKMSYFSSNGTYIFETVILPDTIEKIGADAFYACSKLKKINMPANLKSIGSLAFYNCRSLTEITLPEALQSIGKNAFSYCSSLQEIYLPAGIESIGTGAFMGCGSLENISLPDGNANYRVMDSTLYTADGTMLLAHPGALGGELSVQEGTLSIAYGACTGSMIETVSLPETLQYIGNFAFYSCNNLKAPVLPDGLLEIGYHAFDTYSMAFDTDVLNSDVQNIHIGSSLVWIGEHAFDGFVLKSITVSEENTRFTASDGVLMNGAGDSVISLTIDANGQIIIPEGTIAFDFDMLQFLDSLNNLTFSAVRHVFLPESLQRFPEDVQEYEYSNLFFHCVKGSAAETFLLDNNIPYSSEMSSAYHITETETETGVITARIYDDYAMIVGFAGDGEVLDIPAVIEDKPVRVIGDGENAISLNGYHYGFNANISESPNLKEVIIPEGVEEIRAKALSGFGWSSHVSVSLPSTVKSIGEEALTGCTGINLPQGIERLGRNFTDSELEGGFTLTPSVVSVDPEAFASCRMLSKYSSTGENDIYKVIDGVLFSADGKILISYPPSGSKNYSVPEGTETLGCRSFSGCWQIAGVSLPQSLKLIEDAAFYGCWNLSEVTFSEGVIDRIGTDAFRYCAELSSIELPLVKEIGESAFASCSKLSDVTFTHGLRVIGERAFSETAVGDPQLPNSVRSVGSYAFYSYNGGVWDGAPEQLFIGMHMTSIGTEAFANIGAAAYEVEEANSYYASIDGFLTDKAGNTLISCPSGMKGEVWVPEGITGIAANAFINAKGVTMLHIPDSVEYISSVNFDTVASEEPDEEGNTVYEYTVTICCSEDSSAHLYALENGIPFILE